MTIIQCTYFFWSSLDLTGPLLLGGLLQLPVDFPVPYQHFTGCIRNVYIDHKFLDLSRPLYKNGTSEKCKAMGDTCSYKPCQRGKCSNILGTRQCECPSGFGGSRCESGNEEKSVYLITYKLQCNVIEVKIWHPELSNKHTFNLRCWLAKKDRAFVDDTGIQTNVFYVYDTHVHFKA